MKAINSVLLTFFFCVFYSNDMNAQDFDPKALKSTIMNILEGYNVPGAGIALITKDSTIWMGTLGQADLANSVPVTKNTLFTIGSLSKTFLSAAAMIAQEKGILDINDPIKKLSPSLEFKNPWNNTHPVRFVHLLEHTSGFDEAHFSLYPLTDSSTPLAEVMKHSKKSLITRWKPGSYFEYNTLGYITAAHIIKENVGVSYQDFVQANILRQLEMGSATYFPKDSVTPHFSKGYNGSMNKEVPFPNIPQWPAGALTTTVNGVANFVKMLLNLGRFKDHQILGPISIKRMETSETSLQAKAGVGYGYSKGIIGKIEKGHLFYSHTGRYGGFLSELGYSRELNLGYVILINNSDKGKAIEAIKAVLLATIEKQVSIQVNQHSEEVSERIRNVTGSYQPITSIPQLGKLGYFIYRLIDMPIILEENGQLHHSTMMGDKQKLYHVKDMIFKGSNEPMATSAFVETEDNNWQWLTNEGSYKQIPNWWAYLQFYLALISVILLLVGFVSLLFLIPTRLIRNKKENLQLQLLPFLAICSLLGMLISIVAFYDPEEMYSAGAILFLVFGWLFFILSFIASFNIFMTIYKQVKVNAWIKYHVLLINLACCLSASYLLYWDIIGLTLWNY